MRSTKIWFIRGNFYHLLYARYFSPPTIANHTIRMCFVDGNMTRVSHWLPVHTNLVGCAACFGSEFVCRNYVTSKAKWRKTIFVWRKGLSRFGTWSSRSCRKCIHFISDGIFFFLKKIYLIQFERVGCSFFSRLRCLNLSVIHAKSWKWKKSK